MALNHQKLHLKLLHVFIFCLPEISNQNQLGGYFHLLHLFTRQIGITLVLTC